MADWVTLSIKGLQEAQGRNMRAIANLKPTGKIGEAWRWGTAEMTGKAVIHTPWDTRSLAASHRGVVDRNQLLGTVFIDPRATNPRSPTRPAEYGVYLHRQGMIPGIRGGIRAFYEYTIKTHGARIAQRMIDIIKGVLP